MKPKAKTLPLPSVSEIARLVRSVRSEISSEYRAFEGDETPGIQLTIGASLDGSWNYQTGDNSFTGGAYGHPAWGVAGVYRDSNSFEVARQLIDEIAESLHFDWVAQQAEKETEERRALLSAGLHESQSGGVFHGSLGMKR